MRLTWQQTGWVLVLASVAAAVLFLSYPELDIAFSGLFYRAGAGFAHEDFLPFVIIRFFWYDGLVLMAVLTLLMFGFSLGIGARRKVPLKLWGFMVASYLTGPILLANGIFKTYWGRARPRDIVEFGGDKLFSPPLLISDQCDLNCSFVSGEGSAIATAILVLLLVYFPNFTPFWRRFGYWVLLPLAVFGILLRIVMGGHFLSDTVFAFLFCALLVWLFYRLFDVPRCRSAFTWSNIVSDLSKSQS